MDGADTITAARQAAETKGRQEPRTIRARPEARGKFLFEGDEKLWVKGVTYGTFGADKRTGDFPKKAVVEADFKAMAEAGVNAVRIYIIPPRWLLDLAALQGIRVFVGLPWEQHIAFLDEPGRADAIVARLAEELKPISGHPAILAYSVGNEIPASVVRWHGKRKVEQFLKRLTGIIRAADPTALVTYVNFPTTEYLELPFVDFVSFNVYLEDEERLSAYLARLQNIAGERPLLMAEIGLDSRRNGEAAQAKALTWQVKCAFEAGCVGTFVFAWTDEWHRGGHEILDWDFGLTTRERKAKPALKAVSKVYDEVPISDRDWPKMSVVVCSFNGAGTIEETIAALMELEYPDYEVIVVNDGSTDATPEIAARYDVNLISTENRGLSNARNTGMDASSGKYIIYIDDDAYPDPHWLKYLALSFERGGFAACGGPNISPPEDGDTAECVANAPGGPIQVLVDDIVAEHIPGCNMGFRADALRAIGGFDPQFRTAGDDVDCCWRIQEAGGVIGFSHAALVWHHRRPSVSRYLKQQRGYARAEAMVARKWPSKYNSAGHLRWHGRLYGRGMQLSIGSSQRIYHGAWNTAPFQSIYERAPGVWTSLPLMPEWFFLSISAFLIGLLGFDWPVLLPMLGVGLAGMGLSVAMAAKGAASASFGRKGDMKRAPEWKLRMTVFWLHLLQPANRLIGRIRFRLGPWRILGVPKGPFPVKTAYAIWSETWSPPEARLAALSDCLNEDGEPCATGGDYDRHDLAFGVSVFGEARATGMIEEHGAGRQLFRLRAWPVVHSPVLIAISLFALVSAVAFFSQAWIAGGVLAATALVLAIGAYGACAAAMGALERAAKVCFGEQIR